MGKRFGLIMMVMSFLFVLGCAEPKDEQPELLSIEIETPVSKTVYLANEPFSYEGLTIRAHFSDGSSIVVIVEGDMIHPVDTQDAGEKTIIVSYIDTNHAITKTVTFTVNVLEGDSDYPFMPGYLGTLDITPFVGVENRFVGLYVDSVYRELALAGGTRNVVNLRFPEPVMIGAESYVLQFYDVDSTWKNFQGNDGDLVSTYNNFSLNLTQNYTFRLLAVGGEAHGMVSNTVVTSYSVIETRFSGWGLDESMFISGVMAPFVGRGLEFTFTVVTLPQWEPVEGGVTIEWYRLNPLTFEATLIEGEHDEVYVTTEDDLGYLIMAKAVGDGETVGGYQQVISWWGILLPIEGFVTNINDEGFTLVLSYDYELDTEYLFIRDQDWNELEFEVVKLAIGLYRIEVDLTDVTDVQLDYEDLYIVITEPADDEFPMHMTGIWFEIE